MTAMAQKPLVEKIAEIEQYGAYYLVTFGSWQVTIDNAGDIKLPAMVTPDTVIDLIGALTAAEPVARQQKHDNIAAQAQLNDFMKSQREQAEQAAQQAMAQAKGAPRRAPRATAKRVQPQPSKVGGARGTRQVPAKSTAKKTTARRKTGG